MNVKDLEKSLRNKEKKRASKKPVNANEKAIKGLDQAKNKRNYNKDNGIKNKYISIRVTEKVYNQIDAKRRSRDLRSTTEYLETLLRKDGVKIND